MIAPAVPKGMEQFRADNPNGTWDDSYGILDKYPPKEEQTEEEQRKCKALKHERRVVIRSTPGSTHSSNRPVYPISVRICILHSHTHTRISARPSIPPTTPTSTDSSSAAFHGLRAHMKTDFAPTEGERLGSWLVLGKDNVCSTVHHFAAPTWYGSKSLMFAVAWENAITSWLVLCQVGA
ncbi:hypothetical protein DFS34DRAFT_598347 [Phlyctochytrium arcticum]|nr:hypothetical protein DFS34DRAFT_598347 [Phlyctochytrium arcticum]